MHVCIQGWMPWEIQIYVNGREWLARQLDAAGVNYLRHDNALLRIDDLETAGRLCEHFVHKAWPRVLDAFAKRTNPVLPKIREANYGSYYWVLDQAEVATDVMFKVRPALRAVFPDLVRHASLALSSEDVLGFLGRRLNPILAQEVVTDGRRRLEGRRVMHRMGQNWIKMYDTVSVLRVEIVINKPSEFRVLRVVTTTTGRRERRWCQMRNGVSDVAHLPGGRGGQPPLPRRHGRSTLEGQRCRSPRRLVPATDQERQDLRPVQPPHERRPHPLPGRPGR